MRTDTYPLDLLLCLLTSLLLLPLVFLDIDSVFRLILGFPFLLFIPGYVLVFALFPARKTDRGIDALERLVLSFGLSIAVVPLIGLLLNYTPWGIRLEPIMLSLLLFILIVGLYGFYRWRKTDPEERFTLPQKLTIPKQEHPIDRALTIIFIIAILVVIAALIYVIAMPKTGETFTEFYLLGPTGKATDYPRNLTINEDAAVIIGVANHEHRLINYTIEIWLINQTTVDNQTIYHQMWQLDTLATHTLPHQPISTEEPWSPQWVTTYVFRINRTGTFKLAFLLFTTPTQPYDPSVDYHTIAEQRLTSTYLQNHLWVTVK
jgi:uncharacterized membrane protein